MIFDIENIFILGASVILYDLIRANVHRAYPNIKKFSDIYEKGIVEYTIPNNSKNRPIHNLNTIIPNNIQLFSKKIRLGDINGILQVYHKQKYGSVYTLTNLIPNINIDNETYLDYEKSNVLTYSQASRIERFEYIPDKRNYDFINNHRQITIPNETIYLINYQPNDKIYLHLDGQKNCLAISKNIHNITNRIYHKQVDLVCHGIALFSCLAFYVMFKDLHDHAKRNKKTT